jgi:hypothetical protein
LSTDANSSTPPPPIIYATYDQGSIRKPSIWPKYIPFMPIIIASIGAAVSFIIFLEQRRKKQNFRYLACKIYIDMGYWTPEHLKDPIRARELLVTNERTYSIKLWEDTTYTKLAERNFIEKDLSLIDQFYYTVKKHDEEVKRQIPTPIKDWSTVDKLNQELKDLLEKGKEIIWRKYTGFRFITRYSEDNDDTVKEHRPRRFKYTVSQIIIGIFVGIVIAVTLLVG